MSEHKHTPGPWLPLIGSMEDQHTPASPYLICTVECSNGSQGYKSVVTDERFVGPEQWEANVHLLAAAPDLLEAVLIALEVAELGNHAGAETIDLLRAAIAKAKGEA